MILAGVMGVSSANAKDIAHYDYVAESSGANLTARGAQVAFANYQLVGSYMAISKLLMGRYPNHTATEAVQAAQSSIAITAVIQSVAHGFGGVFGINSMSVNLSSPGSVRQILTIADAFITHNMTRLMDMDIFDAPPMDMPDGEGMFGDIDFPDLNFPGGDHNNGGGGGHGDTGGKGEAPTVDWTTYAGGEWNQGVHLALGNMAQAKLNQARANQERRRRMMQQQQQQQVSYRRSRELLQDANATAPVVRSPPPPAPPPPVPTTPDGALAASLAQTNAIIAAQMELLGKLVANGTTITADMLKKLLEEAGKAVTVQVGELANAAQRLGSGQMSPADFANMYTGQGLTDRVQAAQSPAAGNPGGGDDDDGPPIGLIVGVSVGGGVAVILVVVLLVVLVRRRKSHKTAPVAGGQHAS